MTSISPVIIWCHTQQAATFLAGRRTTRQTGAPASSHRLRVTVHRGVALADPENLSDSEAGGGCCLFQALLESEDGCPGTWGQQASCTQIDSSIATSLRFLLHATLLHCHTATLWRWVESRVACGGPKGPRADLLRHRGPGHPCFLPGSFGPISGEGIQRTTTAGTLPSEERARQVDDGPQNSTSRRPSFPHFHATSKEQRVAPATGECSVTQGLDCLERSTVADI